jgi:hypothetical protein
MTIGEAVSIVRLSGAPGYIPVTVESLDSRKDVP